MTAGELRAMGARLIALAYKLEPRAPDNPELTLIEGGTLGAAHRPTPPDDPSYLAQFASAILRARRLRDRMLPSDLFADPAWDMLLDLYVHGALGRRLSVTAVCGGSQVPSTTALRWIDLLDTKGLVRRRDDPRDGRRRFIELTPCGEATLSRLLGAMALQVEHRSRQHLFGFQENVS